MADFSAETNMEELAISNMQRLQRLAHDGVSIGGIETSYLARLLEHLVGDNLTFLRMQHQLWLAEQLDGHEKAAAQARLLAGIANGDTSVLK